MRKLGEYLAAFSIRRALRITNIRILSQAFFFFIFLFSVWATWTSRVGGYPVSRLLEMDPLVMIATMLSTGHVYRYLGWGLLVLALTLLFGRVFCNWICPYGTLHQFVGWLFNIGTGKKRIEDNQYRPIYHLKYVILIIFLLMAAMGALQIGLLDPICLMYRTFATVVAPATDLGIDKASEAAHGVGVDTLWLDNLKFGPGVERRVFVGSFWIAVMLFGL
ncbi:MAG TPA: 4Fe-4S binding protein, partial [Candidatus Hydrogenedentes bacterium]|nr:4Fe-4S binding protein [Candidatus Hydrogenedentota bacterium]